MYIPNFDHATYVSPESLFWPLDNWKPIEHKHMKGLFIATFSVK